MDIQQQIDVLSDRINQTLIDLEQAMFEVIKSREKVVKLEIADLHDRLISLEQDIEEKNKKLLCDDCVKCFRHCQCEINYIVSDLFVPTSPVSESE
jgi:hypothetical protein